jgi:starch synthase
MASKLYAACDFFLMPSKSEPCGLSQMIAMRYGSIPVVRETGGLWDTVPPLNVETLEGRGFTFKGYNAHDMLGAIDRCIDFYYDKEKWNKHVKNLIRYNSSWKVPVQEYLRIYNEI